MVRITISILEAQLLFLAIRFYSSTYTSDRSMTGAHLYHIRTLHYLFEACFYTTDALRTLITDSRISEVLGLFQSHRSEVACTG